MIWAVSLLTMDLSTHCLTPGKHVDGIRSLTELGNPWRAPHPISALPPRLSFAASPKAISGRTSYLRVRLAFHPYPHLIPRFFNIGGFGPPLSFTSASPWTWVDHPVSGSTCPRRVRLAVQPSPHLIPRFFVSGGFGPPLTFASASPWTWVHHPVPGRRLRTHAPCSDPLSLRLRFLTLTSHASVTRR